MAKKKQEEPPKGSPAWMATFSDLMNLLLCFFVLLFSMSTVDAEKFEMVVSSFQESFSILPSGGSSIGEGDLVSSGVSMMEQFDVYLQSSSGGESDSEDDQKADGEDTEAAGTVEEDYEAMETAESEQMAEDIEEAATKAGIQDQVEVEFNAQYVLLTLNGALLFDSGQASVRDDAKPLLTKIATILDTYDNNIIDIEGHTDNVPITSSKYENNDVLSMYRALYVTDFMRENTNIDTSHFTSSGRGSYVPIADNSTAEGRARNRRVEIKIYNSYNSEGLE